MPQIQLICYVVSDGEEALNLFPELVIDKADKWLRDVYVIGDTDKATIAVTARYIIGLYHTTHHWRYILMLYMLLQEIEEIEVGSSDDLPPQPGDANYDEQYASYMKRHHR